MNHRHIRRITANLILHFLALSVVFSQTTGTISGSVRDSETREPVLGANIRIVGTAMGSAADETGAFKIANVAPGTYSLTASGVGYKMSEVSVSVEAGRDTKKDFVLIPEAIQSSDVVVFGASLRRERIIEAPASVRVLDAKDIARNAPSGQLAKLLETQPGVDIVQSGLFDFNLNTRGFNSSLNRRILILLDGRDLGTAFLGAPEWNGMSVPVEEMGRVELVCGPGSALYGANAYNGVLNVSTFPPKASLGTRVTVGGGELSTVRGDLRHAGTYQQWSYRMNIGGASGKSFSTVRTGGKFEYPGMHPIFNDELVDLDLSPVQQMYASARVDYDYENGGVATIEGGITEIRNEVYVTGIGRVQSKRARRPFGRVSYQGHGVSLNLWTNVRQNVEPEMSLSTGLPLTQDASVSQGEAQYAFSTLNNDLSFIFGVSHRLVSIDTKGSLMLSPRDDNMSGVFGQAEYRIASDLKGVVAARWDRSTLHPSQFSPKAAIVWSFSSGQSVRFTYNKAFQSPNYSELFLFVRHPTKALAYFGNLVTDPPGLTGFQAGVQPGAPKDLTVEKITGYEIGYKGIFSNSFFVTVDAYYNQMSDFVTDLAAGVNPKYPAAGLFSNDPPSIPSRTIWSYINAGRVNETGLDVGVNYYATEAWQIDANYSLFDSEVFEKNQNDILIPNSPKYRLSGGVTYVHPDGHDVKLSFKYVPTFPWAAGIFVGDIPAYTLVNLAGSYRFSDRITFNLAVSNLLDRQHYEIFGGSIIGRRAISTMTVNL